MVYFPDEVWINSRSATVYIDGSSAVSGRDREFAGGQQYIRSDLVPQWQQIETAPRDNKRILVYVPRYGAMSANFDEGRFNLHACLNKEALPTHWMPIPKVPE